MMKRIVLVEPRALGYHIYTRVVIPRLGPILLGTILRDRGYEVEVYVEELLEPTDEELFSADLVGISTITNTAPRAYEIADRVRAQGIPVVMGGFHPTFMPDEALDHADYVVRGEGEQTLVELLEALEGGGNLEAIAGLSWWDGPRKRHNPPRALIADLDTNPIPDYSLVRGWNPVTGETSEWTWKAKGVVSILTSRGCPFTCNFCAVIRFFGRGFRNKSIPRVMEEIRRQKGKHVFFCDDNFAIDRKRTKELLRQMIAEGIPGEWSAQVRADVARDEELLELMAQSNCYNVYIGFESINPKTLKYYQKKLRVEDIEYSIRKFHEYGIRIHGMFVLGSDEDDVATIRQTARFAIESELDTIQFMIMTPVPGTELYTEFEADRRILTTDWRYYDGHYAVVKPKRMSPYELQREVFWAHKRFYSLGQALRWACRRDVFLFLMRIYGWLYLKKWRRENRDYFKALKADLYRELALVGPPVRRSHMKVAILAVEEIGGQALTTLRRFLEELGHTVITAHLEEPPATQAPPALTDWIVGTLSHLRGKVDVVVVPVREGLERSQSSLSTNFEALMEALRGQLKAAPRLVPFWLEAGEEPLHLHYARLGLFFTRSLKKIRLAYGRAAEATSS
jgi:radical SAM superfamily enzyme YgiQ (UPF0313 family)